MIDVLQQKQIDKVQCIQPENDSNHEADSPSAQHFNQQELNNLIIGDVNLSKESSESLASRLNEEASLYYMLS